MQDSDGSAFSETADLNLQIYERNDFMKNEIIRILQQNARISNTALGEALGITAEQAAEEISKLENEGVIRGYSVILDDEKI